MDIKDVISKISILVNRLSINSYIFKYSMSYGNNTNFVEFHITKYYNNIENSETVDINDELLSEILTLYNDEFGLRLTHEIKYSEYILFKSHYGDIDFDEYDKGELEVFSNDVCRTYGFINYDVSQFGIYLYID